MFTEVTATGDVQSGSRLGPDVVDATVVGVAVVCIGLNTLLTMELDTLSRLEDRAELLSYSAEIRLHRFWPFAYQQPYGKSGIVSINNQKEHIKGKIGRTSIIRFLLVKISAL